MKIKHLLTLLLITFSSYIFAQQNNSELQKMYNEDQGSRMTQNIDWSLLSKQDKERETRVFEMIKAGEIVTGIDYYNSAMIFQHGNDTIASSMAVRHMKKAIELDSRINKWLLAAAIDRDLMRRNKPQIYGTQYIKNSNTNGKFVRYQIDSTKISDEERRAYKVETLKEQVEKERVMNLKSLAELLIKPTTLKDNIKLIKSEFKKGKNSTYNVNEEVINSFGYELLKNNKTNDALEIFKLNTVLYPNAWNTYDSLGELLLQLNKKTEAYKNYQKSLDLNPQNENARKILSERK